MEEQNFNYENPIIQLDDNKFLTKTFMWMFLGLFATAIIAIYTYYSGFYEKILLESGSFGIICIVEIAVVLIFSLLFKKLPAFIVGILYFIYAAVNGVTLSVIFAAFELNSIVILFFAASGLFAILALYGYNTKHDFSNWGSFLTITLIIGLVVSIINLFVGNSLIDIIIDWVILFVFCGFTIYDINKLKALSTLDLIDPDKIYVYAAMQLYLDFINLFLRILSIFGKRRD